MTAEPVCGYCVDGVDRVASPVLGEGLTLSHGALPSAGRRHDQHREKRVARYRHVVGSPGEKLG